QWNIIKARDPNANKFSTRAGDIIRRHIPINIEDWRNVPDSFKNDLWHYLMVCSLMLYLL
ncbi:hypothetical protein MKW94_020110, partial [Papaver nudicaule]|nr:hypothetical protein [Papaver nudicaule]